MTPTSLFQHQPGHCPRPPFAGSAADPVEDFAALFLVGGRWSLLVSGFFRLDAENVPSRVSGLLDSDDSDQSGKGIEDGPTIAVEGLH